MTNELDVEKIIAENLGFEDTEEDTNGGSDEQPFDADKIRIEQQMLSVKYLFELYEGGLLDTAPNFQRKSVWKDNKRKSLLIESLMLRIPIPAFYFFENEDSRFHVIDGQQRLLTIFEFLEGKFKLSGLEYISDKCDKKFFDELDMRYKQRIYRTQLAVNILDARSPHVVIYDIFRRINTGGMSLTLQEMRNAICKQPARDFLVKGTNSKFYQAAIRNKINDVRMDSQEMVLRFVALYKNYDYKKSQLAPFYHSKLSVLLDQEIIHLQDFSEQEMDKIYSAFEFSMKNCEKVFGDKAFVKIYNDNGNIKCKRDLINKSLFTSFAVILANEKYSGIKLEQYRNDVLYSLAEALENKEYENAVSGATGDRRNIISNFRYSQEVIDKCIKV